MAMHPCLHALDILENVFQLVFEEPESGPKSMVALACTCRTFQDTALDILWRTIPSLAPLIKCLPPDVWHFSVNNQHAWVWSLKRPTILSDWVRCKTYTPRIRHLGFGGKHQYPVAGDVMAALEQHEVLPLPNLRTYRCDGPSSVGSLGPKLLGLEMVYPGRDEAFSHFPKLVDSLKTSSPFIQKIAVPRLEGFSTSSSLRLPNDFGDAVARFSRLGVLSIVNFILPDDTLRMLASSHTIRGLKTDNTSEDFLRCLPSCGPIFPELEDLSFRTGHLPECSDLIRQLVPHRLQSIAVTYDIEIAEIPVTESHVHKFFRALETHCASAVLTSIFLHQRKYENQEDLICTMDTLEPLLSFRHLRELDLFFNEIEYRLDNTSVERMTTAWPHMRRLSLDFKADWGSEIQSDITLDGLLPMAKNWPQLEYLSLSFYGETSVNDVPLLKPGAGSCCYYLQSINVGYSLLKSNPGVVAAFLTAIFPNLRHIGYHDDVSGWSSVACVVDAMGKVWK